MQAQESETDIHHKFLHVMSKKDASASKIQRLHKEIQYLEQAVAALKSERRKDQQLRAVLSNRALIVEAKSLVGSSICMGLHACMGESMGACMGECMEGSPDRWVYLRSACRCACIKEEVGWINHARIVYVSLSSIYTLPSMHARTHTAQKPELA